MLRTCSKLLDILIIILSGCFLIVSFVKYFVLHQFSLDKFVITALVSSIFLIYSWFSLFDRVRSLQDIIVDKPYRVTDHMLNICILVFGLCGIYISLFWTASKTIKVISFVGSTFFIFGSIFVIISDYKRWRK